MSHFNPEKASKIVVKTVKKYIFVIENLNFGIGNEDEKHIIRYDLKGSTLNRFVQEKELKEKLGEKKNHNDSDFILEDQLQDLKDQMMTDPDFTLEKNLGNSLNRDLLLQKWSTAPKRVYHDNNFIYQMAARPVPMRYNMNKILNICVNNDTLCLSKSQIIDYSLFVVINTRTKKLRFGIIDYVQHYTLEKMLENKFKKMIKRNEPTITEPERYKKRFKNAVKRYFIGMCVQNEKSDAGPDSSR